VSGWSGRAIRRRVLLALVSTLLGLHGCFDLTADPAPSVTLVPSTGQLNLYNGSGSDLQLWGDRLQGFPSDIEKQGQIIPANGVYYFRTDRLRSLMLSTVGNQGEKLIRFDVYLSDTKGRNYIATFMLLIKMISGGMTIQTQQQKLRLASADWVEQ
jgi:hypothetical protein